jgi:hypothetical protein
MRGRILSIAAATLGLSFSAGAAVACPDWQLNGQQGSFTGEQLYQARTFEVTAGGEFPLLDTCAHIYKDLKSDKGQGFFTRRPDFTLETPGLAGYKLVISVVSDCDSTLLINTPAENWYFDDDDNGNLDAKIELTSPSSGILDIWVGTADGEFCDARLSLETF